MAIIVQKFGGTSVATPQAREALLKQVKKCKDEGNDVVVVVSALGRKGDPYATDTLISLLEEISPNIYPEKKDLMMSCGEIISCSLVSHLLDSNGIPSESLTGFQAGILTNNNFNNSEILDIDTTVIEKHLKDNKVVVIAGFQGATIDEYITTLGRGGSDTAAVAIGGYLKADRVDIFTDVPGIAKVDPRVVPSAPYLSSISYNDMYKLAYHGAKVIHPRAVMTAQNFNIPVRVRSTFSDGLGTLISDEKTKFNHKIIGMALEKEVSYIKVKKNHLAQTDFSKNPNALFKHTKDHVEAYYHKDLITYPLDLDEDSLIENKYPVGQISMIFHKDHKEELEKELINFLEDTNLNTQDILWSENQLTLLLSVDNLVSTTQELYAYFH